MNQKTLNKLEFTKIIDLLAEKASSPGGKNACKHLKPMTDLEQIDTMQEDVDVLKKVVQEHSEMLLRLA